MLCELCSSDIVHFLCRNVDRLSPSADTVFMSKHAVCAGRLIDEQLLSQLKLGPICRAQRCMRGRSRPCLNRDMTFRMTDVVLAVSNA